MTVHDSPSSLTRADVRLVLELPRQPTSAETARHALDAYRRLIVPEALDDARLVVTELVANAVRHGDGKLVKVLLTLDGRGDLHGEIVDDGSGFEPPSGATATVSSSAAGGRGLPIVDAIVDAWGVEEGSTHVWFRINGAGPALPAQEP